MSPKSYIVDDYDFKFFKIVKTILRDYSFRLKVKIVVGDYDFNYLKIFKTIVNYYNFNFKPKTVVHKLWF